MTTAKKSKHHFQVTCGHGRAHRYLFASKAEGRAWKKTAELQVAQRGWADPPGHVHERPGRHRCPCWSDREADKLHLTQTGHDTRLLMMSAPAGARPEWARPLREWADRFWDATEPVYATRIGRDDLPIGSRRVDNVGTALRRAVQMFGHLAPAAIDEQERDRIRDRLVGEVTSAGYAREILYALRAAVAWSEGRRPFSSTDLGPFDRHPWGRLLTARDLRLARQLFAQIDLSGEDRPSDWGWTLPDPTVLLTTACDELHGWMLTDFLIGAATGARSTEKLAFRVTDFGLRPGLTVVRVQRKRDRGPAHNGGSFDLFTKDRHARYVVVPELVAELLLRPLVAMYRTHADDERWPLVPVDNYDRCAAYRRAFAGLGPLAFNHKGSPTTFTPRHTRHWTVSLLVHRLGAPPAWVSRLCGHYLDEIDVAARDALKAGHAAARTTGRYAGHAPPPDTTDDPLAQLAGMLDGFLTPYEPLLRQACDRALEQIQQHLRRKPSKVVGVENAVPWRQQ